MFFFSFLVLTITEICSNISSFSIPPNKRSKSQPNKRSSGKIPVVQGFMRGYSSVGQSACLTSAEQIFGNIFTRNYALKSLKHWDFKAFLFFIRALAWMG